MTAETWTAAAKLASLHSQRASDAAVPQRSKMTVYLSVS